MKRLRNVFVIVLAISTINVAPVRADQPLMRKALHHLREARQALTNAARNKGGHRERALENIDRAIAQVEAGMKYAR